MKTIKRLIEDILLELIGHPEKESPENKESILFPIIMMCAFGFFTTLTFMKFPEWHPIIYVLLVLALFHEDIKIACTEPPTFHEDEL